MKKYIVIVLLIGVIAVGWYLASPLFIDKTVDESLPFSGVSVEEYEEMADALTMIGMEAPSMNEMKEMTEEEVQDLEVEMIEMSEKAMPSVEVEEEMPTEPVVLHQGSFVGADRFHQGSGSASIYRLPDESNLLRFENFSVTNGPDLRVLLAVDGDPTNAVELGKLKGNKGDQNYPIASEVDLEVYNTVMIYCKPFRVNFATAELGL